MLDLLDCMLPGFHWFVLCLNEKKTKQITAFLAMFNLGGGKSRFDLVTKKTKKTKTQKEKKNRVFHCVPLGIVSINTVISFTTVMVASLATVFSLREILQNELINVSLHAHS